MRFALKVRSACALGTVLLLGFALTRMLWLVALFARLPRFDALPARALPASVARLVPRLPNVSLAAT